MIMARRQPLMNLTSSSISSIAAITTTALLIFLLRPQQLQAADANSSRGLSLTLIHRDSIHSPLYPGPLTDLERLERTMRFSRFPVGPNSSTSLGPLADTDGICGIEPFITYGGLYLVTFSIGTPSKVLTLALDTGSNLVWTQCVPSDPQFHQFHPLFNPAGSSSFRVIDSQHEQCEPPTFPNTPYCKYNLAYGGGERSSGFLCYETFHFRAPQGDGGIKSIPNLKFGCSHESYGGHYHPTEDGILGMDSGPLSFASQLGSYYGGRFSYCLFDQMETLGVSSLIFGDDINMVGDVQTTPFMDTTSTQYYLNLEDITLSGLSLGLDAEVYRPGDLEQRGTVIDSGSVVFLYYPVFDALKDIISAYFALYDYTPIYRVNTDRPSARDICYEDTKPLALREDMSLTYKFQGSTFLEVPSKYLFVKLRRRNQSPVFCLNLVRDDKLTIIGSTHQMDVRFTYDLVERVLEFVPERCFQMFR